MIINPFKQTYICCTCKIEKYLFEFHKRVSAKFGYSYRCRHCAIQIVKKRYKENKQSILKYRYEWGLKNKEKNKIIKKRYRDSVSLERKRIYKRTHRERINETARIRIKERYKTDINFKLKRRISSQILNMVKHGCVRKAYKTEILLGCTVKEFKDHLESKFQEGMSWDNHGIGAGKWNIDHIIPCSMFNIADPEQQKLAFNYKNTQPMWSEENIAKGNRTAYCLIV